MSFKYLKELFSESAFFSYLEPEISSFVALTHTLNFYRDFLFLQTKDGELLKRRIQNPPQ